MYLHSNNRIEYDANRPSHLNVSVSGGNDPSWRVHISFDVSHGVALSLDEAKVLHTRLDLALREAYDDIEVRNECDTVS